MPELAKDMIEAALSEALNTMAFMTPLPPEDHSAPQAPACINRITFSGMSTGALELVCPLAFGVSLAANCMGLDSQSPEAAAASGDAIRELLNVTCGAMLRSSGLTTAGLIEMSVPTQESFDLQRWGAFVESGAVVVDAEGHKLAVRIVESD